MSMIAKNIKTRSAGHSSDTLAILNGKDMSYGTILGVLGQPIRPGPLRSSLKPGLQKAYFDRGRDWDWSAPHRGKTIWHTYTAHIIPDAHCSILVRSCIYYL